MLFQDFPDSLPMLSFALQILLSDERKRKANKNKRSGYERKCRKMKANGKNVNGRKMKGNGRKSDEAVGT